MTMDSCCFHGNILLFSVLPQRKDSNPHTSSFSVYLSSVCVECRAVTGRESPVCLLETCHYLLTMNPQECQSVSDWLNLNGGSRDGFKAGLTLISSDTMYLDKEQAHNGHWDTSN